MQKIEEGCEKTAKNRRGMKEDENLKRNARWERIYKESKEEVRAFLSEEKGIVNQMKRTLRENENLLDHAYNLEQLKFLNR